MTVGNLPDLFASLDFNGLRSIPPFECIGVNKQSHTPRDYSADGVVAGESQVLDRLIQISVGIICHDWPGWSYAFSHHCFDLKFICVLNPLIFEDIKNTFCGTYVFLFNSCSVSSQLFSVDILCFNGKGAIRLTTPPAVGVITLFDWKFRNRGAWRQWTFTSDKISHSQCGGASSFIGHLTFGCHSDVQHFWKVPFGRITGSYPVCNLGALIKCTVGGTELLNDPGLSATVPTHTVGLLGKNLFHYKGLFPFGSWKAEFITPCVFTKLKLVRRRLSSNELQEVMDIPVKGMRKRSFLRLLPHIVVPIKVLSAVVSQCILDHDFSLPRGVGDDRVATVLDEALTPRQALTDTPVDTHRLTEEEVTNTLPKGWIANQLEAKSETAAKDDDAQVPLQFWNSALETKLQRNLNINEIAALNKIRDFVVEHIWKRSITKCFCKWMRCKDCHANRVNTFFDSRKKDDTSWRSFCSKCVLNLRNNEVEQWVDSKGYLNFNWKIKGRMRYQKWYNKFYQRHLPSRVDIQTSREAGIDCIKRTINASTWAWDNGSRLYFW